MGRRAIVVLLTCVTLGLFTTPLLAQEEVVNGKIERIDTHGRITVGGQSAQITAATKLTTSDSRPLTLHELTVGVFVEMSVVDSRFGTEATSITADVLR